jgi:hypothetical protein
MVYKKYIKRKGKIFGPYLYENYRENGITKTRYLGPAPKSVSKKFKDNILRGNHNHYIFLFFLF